MKFVKKNEHRFLDEAANVRLALKKHRYGLIALSCITVVALIAVVHVASQHTVVLIPYGLKERALVSGNHASDLYLTTLAVADTELFLTIDPDNVTGNSALFLSRVDPKLYHSTQQQLLTREASVKTNNVSQAFYPSDIRVDSEESRVVMKGRLSRFSSGHALKSQELTVCIRYRWVNGFAYIHEWDVKHD